MTKLKNNDLVKTFLELEGNPKWSLITEPLWFIPFALFSPFASLYMYQKGLSSQEIGLLITLGYILQVFFAFAGGVIVDKMGRRLSTFIFDFIGWSIPCFIWAFAQNFWWFFIATIVNAAIQVTHTSWNCLFIEDCPPKHLTNSYTLLQVTGLLSVFFSPITVVLVDKFSVTQVVSVLYFISAISMSAKFILLYVFGRETSIGYIRLKETKNISYFKMFSGYGLVIKKILKSSNMRFVLIFMAIINVTLIATTSFFSLFVTESLNISDEYVAIFPIVRTIIMIVFIAFLQNTMNRLRMRKSLILGFAFYIFSHILLLLARQGDIIMVLLYTVFEAMSYAIVMPRKEALTAFYVDKGERSRIFAVFNAGTIAVTAPFGYIIGLLFEIDPVIPFIANILLFVVIVVLVIKLSTVDSFDEEVS